MAEMKIEWIDIGKLKPPDGVLYARKKLTKKQIEKLRKAWERLWQTPK